MELYVYQSYGTYECHIITNINELCNIKVVNKNRKPISVTLFFVYFQTALTPHMYKTLKLSKQWYTKQMHDV